MTNRAPHEPTGSPGSTVLLVDDEPDILLGYKMALENGLGVRVETARSGLEALGCLTTLRPDIIVSDYRMPVMDGMEFFTRVRGLAPHIPLVMLTAYPDSDLAATAIARLGVSRFFSKTIAPEQLVEEVRRLLARPRVPSPGPAAAAKAPTARRSGS